MTLQFTKDLCVALFGISPRNRAIFAVRTVLNPVDNIDNVDLLILF